MIHLATETAETKTAIAVRLPEWTELTPAETGAGRVLRGLWMGEEGHVRDQVEALNRAGVLVITERRDGVAIRSRSYVGRLSVGPLEITIVPKISWSRWLSLLAFALELRGLVRTEHLDFDLESTSLVELLVLELVAEARDLLHRGLHREGVEKRARLEAPRGRIEFSTIARRGGIREAAVPCRFTRRSDDLPLNRVLLAGLRFAGSRTRDRKLRADAVRLAQQLEQRSVSQLSLSREFLQLAEGTLDRRTRRYAPALRLIRMLLEGESVSLEDGADGDRISLPGFALDMNRIWQQLLSRVLGEWAEDGVSVRDELPVSGVFGRVSDFPSRRPLPRMRPDFAVFVDGRLRGFLDAKYRDLAERPLPREMLYQLAMYSLAQGGSVAAILYPTDLPQAEEERVEVRHPVTGAVQATVALRPVLLRELEPLISEALRTGIADRHREFAARLLGVGGEEAPSRGGGRRLSQLGDTWR
jgi:5-methylcytosine-specific restriction enzyme subunit McrC